MQEKHNVINFAISRANKAIPDEKVYTYRVGIQIVVTHCSCKGLLFTSWLNIGNFNVFIKQQLISSIAIH